jgi:hypothetical protein
MAGKGKRRRAARSGARALVASRASRSRATARGGALRPGGLVVDRHGLRLTLQDDTRAIDIRGCTGG